MKKLILFSFMFLASVVAFAQNKVVPNNAEVKNQAPSFKWTVNQHDFGKIEKNKPVTYEFKFTNTGSSALIISNVSASCGCTVPDYVKEPIAPGRTGYVKATYNAANAGAFTKTITVTSNTGTNEQLTIKGEVVEKPVDATNNQ